MIRKHCKRICVVLAVLSLCIFVDAQNTTHQITLKQAVETALANNLTVRQSELQMETNAVSLNQAKGNIVPQLSGSIYHYLNQGRSIDPASNGYINQQLTTANYALITNVTLFNGFRLLNAVKQNQYAYEASRMDWQQSKDKLMLDVMLAYLTVLNNEDLLIQMKRQVEVTINQVNRLEILNNEGALKPPSDLYDLRGQLANDQLSVINTQNALDAGRIALAQLMNIPYDNTLEVERLGADQFDMNYPGTPDSIYQVAVQQLAVIKSVELKNKSFEKEVSAARGNLFPSLGFGAGINTNYSSLSKDALNNKIPYSSQLKNNYGTYLGAGINIPILNNFRYRNQVTLAKIDLKNAKASKETVIIQLKQNIERDFFNMKAALERYKTLNEQVTAYTESFRAADIRFANGVGTSVDYLIAKNNLDRAKNNLIIARYEYLLRIKIMDYYQGKPLW